MTDALALDSRAVVLELHKLCRDLDPARWRAGIEAALRQRVDELRARFSGIVARCTRQDPASERPQAQLDERLRQVSELLHEPLPEPSLPAGELAAAWAGYRQRLVQAYEDLSVSLRAHAVHVPALRPTNYVRNGFHVASATTAILLLELVLSERQRALVPLCIALSFWFLETLRQHWLLARRFLLWIFKSIAHPHERYRVNSSTWFMTALTLLGVAFDVRICAVAIAVLGLGDPAAALVGRRWGRTRFASGRSLEGTVTFVVAGCAAALLVQLLWHGDTSWPLRIALALGAAVAGALAELFSWRVDDNFSIPVAAALGGQLTLLALG
jgi:dolichol kinase